jgi:hypothetical protein
MGMDVAADCNQLVPIIEHLRNDRHLRHPGSAAHAPPEHDSRSAGNTATSTPAAIAYEISLVARDLGFG